MEDKRLDEIKSFFDEIHLRNKNRIKFGLKCMYIIPAVFLVLMFISSATGSSKVTFLILWIASMFIISVILIVIEYVDYNYHKKIGEVLDEEEEYRGITPVIDRRKDDA